MTFTTLSIVYFRFVPLFYIYSVPYALLATLDYCLFGSGALLGIYNTLIFASSIIVVSKVSRPAFASQRKLLKVEKRAFEERSGGGQHSSMLALSHLAHSVASFRAGHTHLVGFLATFNRTLSAKFFSSFLLGNLSYNAYSFIFIAYNGKHSVGPFFRLAFSCWQVVHAMAPVSVATYVVKINREMYAAQGLIGDLLAESIFQRKNVMLKKETSRLPSSASLSSKVAFLSPFPPPPSFALLREQWKLSTYWELFDRGESASKSQRMAMTAAVFGVSLEWQTMLQFVLIYGAFLMHFGGWIVQGKLAQAEESAFKL